MRELRINQELYAERVLERFNMADCKPVLVPTDPNNKLSKEQCPKTPEERELMEDIPYLNAIGALMWCLDLI